jgi:hypothetical protein
MPSHEKWNTVVNYTKGSTGLERLTTDDHENIKRASVVGNPIDVYEAPKTRPESMAIRRLNDAAARVFAKYGLPSITMDPGLVHLIDKEIYDELIRTGQIENSNGVYADGHLYQKKKSTITHIVESLSHEMAHWFAYHRRNVSVQDTGDRRRVTIERATRGGFQQDSKKYVNLGVGLNEALTEIVSLDLKKDYTRHADLTPKERDYLNSHHSYVPQVMLVHKLCEALEPDDPDMIMEKLKLGYLRGDAEIMQYLQHKIPKVLGKQDGLKILLHMGTKAEDALETAKALKLQSAVELIEDFMNKEAMVKT